MFRDIIFAEKTKPCGNANTSQRAGRGGWGIGVGGVGYRRGILLYRGGGIINSPSSYAAKSQLIGNPYIYIYIYTYVYIYLYLALVGNL
jgi:hypothetical protein